MNVLCYTILYVLCYTIMYSAIIKCLKLVTPKMDDEYGQEPGGCKIPMYSLSQENADFFTMNTQTGSQMDIPEMFQEGKSTNKFFRCQKLCK